MCSFHADGFGQFSDAAARFPQFESQVFAFELLPRFAQRQIKNFRMLRIFCGLFRRILTQSFFHVGGRDFALATQDQQALHQVAQFAQIARPAVIAQPVLRRNRKWPIRKILMVGKPFSIESDQFRHIILSLA